MRRARSSDLRAVSVRPRLTRAPSQTNIVTRACADTRSRRTTQAEAHVPSRTGSQRETADRLQRAMHRFYADVADHSSRRSEFSAPTRQRHAVRGSEADQSRDRASRRRRDATDPARPTRLDNQAGNARLRRLLRQPPLLPLARERARLPNRPPRLGPRRPDRGRLRAIVLSTPPGRG